MQNWTIGEPLIPISTEITDRFPMNFETFLSNMYLYSYVKKLFSTGGVSETLIKTTARS